MAKKLTINQEATAICLVFPLPPSQSQESIHIRLTDFIRLVDSLVGDIFIITGKDVSLNTLFSDKVRFIGHAVRPEVGDSIISTILGELKAQIQITRSLMILPDQVKLIFLRGRASTVVIPLIVAKLKGKKSTLFVESKGSELVTKVYKGPLGIAGFILSQIYKMVEKISYSLSYKLVADFPALLKQPWLDRYKNKLFSLPTPIRFVNPEFKLSTRFEQRRTVVGYIGRMSQEKGVLNLVKAIPAIHSQVTDLEFLFGGGGPLLSQVESELGGFILQGKAKVLGWIQHKEVPCYLNQMKLLVLPSQYEGLGVIVSEAMECGTPVLAVPVGAVQDMIIDGETGFIMEDNSPECIARNVVRALNHPKLDQISRNAHAVIESGYSYTVVKERWRKLLNSLESG